MDEKTEILYLAKEKIKTKILSLMERLEGFTETLAPLRSPEFIFICIPYQSEAMLSDPIRVSKPTTKASEARLYVSSVTWEWFSYLSEGMLSAKTEAMLLAKSASWKLQWSFGLGNPSESFDPICNLRGDEGIGKGIGGGWGSGSFLPIEGIGLWTRTLCDPVEFGFSHVGDRVEHRGESSGGGGGSGEQSSGGGNGNERTGGGRRGGGIEGRQGIVRAGEHGGGNGDDDDGNNGGGRRIGDIENGWMPRILREQNLAVIFLPLTLEVVTVCFGLDDANLSAFDSVLRCFALVCCQGSLVLFMASLLERDERAARNLSIIGSILTALGLISIIAVKFPPNLRFTNGLAFLLVLAIFLKAFPI